MFLEECKYVAKGKNMSKYITDEIEISSDEQNYNEENSDEENFNEEDSDEENQITSYPDNHQKNSIMRLDYVVLQEH